MRKKGKIIKIPNTEKKSKGKSQITCQYLVETHTYRNGQLTQLVKVHNKYPYEYRVSNEIPIQTQQICYRSKSPVFL